MNPSRSGRGRRRMMNEINVVPYIDVMLVLLVIFMVTAPLVTPAQVELPSVQKSSQAPVQPIEIIIKPDGGTRLRDRDKGEFMVIPNSDGTVGTIWNPRPKGVKRPARDVVGYPDPISKLHGVPVGKFDVRLRDQALRGRLLDGVLGDHGGPFRPCPGRAHTSMTTGRIIGLRRVRS